MRFAKIVASAARMDQISLHNTYLTLHPSGQPRIASGKATHIIYQKPYLFYDQMGWRPLKTRAAAGNVIITS